MLPVPKTNTSPGSHSVGQKKREVLAALLLTFSLGGCAGKTMVSAAINEAQSLTTGIFYALPRGHLAVTAARTDGIATLSAAEEPLIFPDPHHRYNLSFRPQIFADDVMTISVAEGMLTSEAKSDNTDQSVAIVTKLLEIAEKAVQGFGDARKETVATYSITQIVDPFDPTSIRSFNASLKSVGEPSLELFVSDTTTGGSMQQLSHSVPGQDCDGSICFRLPVAVFLGLRDRRQPSRIVYQIAAVLPDPRFTASIDVTRRPCIQQITTLTFTTGMLTKNNLDKPSELLKCLEIPAAIVSSLTGDLGKALGFGAKPASSVTQNVIVAPLDASTVGSVTKDTSPQEAGARGSGEASASKNRLLTHKTNGEELQEAN